MRAARRKRLQRRQLVTMADDGHDFLVEMLHGHRRYIAEFLIEARAELNDAIERMWIESGKLDEIGSKLIIAR